MQQGKLLKLPTVTYHQFFVHTHFYRSHWDRFTPYTNVLWVNYLFTKTKIKAKLKGIRSRTWESKFKPYLRDIIKYSSNKEVFLNVFYPDKPIPYRHSHSKQYV